MTRHGFVNAFFCAVIFIMTSSLDLQTAYARARDYDFTGVERMFLEGRYDNVVQESNMMISSGHMRSSELYYIKGLSELKLNRFDDARASFEHIISRYSSSTRAFDAYIGMGDAYMLESKLNEALAIYNKVLEKYPKGKNIAVAYYRLADCYGKLGLEDKASFYLNKAKASAPLSFERTQQPSTPIRSHSNIEVKNVKPATENKEPTVNPVQIPRTESSGYISIQVGCFKNRKNAERLSKKLTKEGYDSYVELPAGSGDRLYRVKIGKFKTETEAENTAFKLRRQGYTTKICASDLCQ